MDLTWGFLIFSGSQRFGPVPVQVRCFLENYSSQEYGCHQLCGCKSKLVPKPVYGGSEGFYEFQLRKPVQAEVKKVLNRKREPGFHRVLSLFSGVVFSWLLL